jgi:hypothetical protein
LKPISIVSPEYEIGSDSLASPTSWVCAGDGQLPALEAQAERRLALGHERGAADDLEKLVAR